MAGLDPVQYLPEAVQVIFRKERKERCEPFKVCDIRDAFELFPVCLILFVDVLGTDDQSRKGRAFIRLTVEIILQLFQVCRNSTIIFLGDIHEIYDIAELIRPSTGVPIRTVDTADSLQKVVFLGVAEKIHLFQPAHVITRGQHEIDDKKVRFQRVLERELGRFVERSRDVLVRDDKTRL